MPKDEMRFGGHAEDFQDARPRLVVQRRLLDQILVEEGAQLDRLVELGDAASIDLDRAQRPPEVARRARDFSLEGRASLGRRAVADVRGALGAAHAVHRIGNELPEDVAPPQEDDLGLGVFEVLEDGPVRSLVALVRHPFEADVAHVAAAPLLLVGGHGFAVHFGQVALLRRGQAVHAIRDKQLASDAQQRVRVQLVDKVPRPAALLRDDDERVARRRRGNLVEVAVDRLG
mmetsp:Transcript_29723/g.100099  ORF Transcript_29723/g.100099 Transcript_29723/m.100099 type:complete len:231 (+) Transcript_29723:274-966(+)